MDTNRKQWNAGHQQLRQALASGDGDRAVKLFLALHAMLHSAKMAKSGLWSFEDEILTDLTVDQVRTVIGEHSITWILYHLARIEDITMNLLVAGKPQIFTHDGWGDKLNVTITHSANKMTAADLKNLSAGIDIRSLKAYRVTVGRRTRQIVLQLKASDFKQKVQTKRIQNVLEEGAVLPEAMEIIQYWSKKTIAGLLLMPATRHNLLHLNEAERIRKQLLK